MPAIQTTYGLMTGARVGQVADMQEQYNAVSRVCETAAGVTAGAVVQRGAADAGCKAIGDGAATKFLGIVVRTQSRDANAPDTFQRYEDVRIMTKGVIWVTAGAAVVQGDQAYYTAAGVLTNVATGNTIITGAVFDTSAASGALAVLRLS